MNHRVIYKLYDPQLCIYDVCSCLGLCQIKFLPQAISWKDARMCRSLWQPFEQGPPLNMYYIYLRTMHVVGNKKGV